MKFIAGAQLNDSVGPIYRELETFSLHKLDQFEVAKITYCAYTKNFPHNLCQYYEKYGSSRPYFTRRSSSLMLANPQVKTSELQLPFWYQSIKIWNSIPISIKLSSCSKFKMLYKNSLLYA